MSVSPSLQSRIAASRSRRLLDDLDVVLFVLVAQRAADVAEHLVAARVAHRVELGDLLRVLALADRGVIVGELPDALRPYLVEAAVADMADRQAAVADDRQRDDAGHAGELVGGCRRGGRSRCWRCAMASRTRSAGRAERSGQALEDHVVGDGGGELARCLTADAVDHAEDAALGVDERRRPRCWS